MKITTQEIVGRNELEINQFVDVMSFMNQVLPVYISEESKLPCHINILDLIWANENAHSRILTALLSQKTKNAYNILDSFLGDLLEISGTNLEKADPRITYEKDRIDVLILTKTFALIIENKIHGAIDQSSQIAGYIDKLKAKGYSEKKIFVAYLTRDGSKIINEGSWLNSRGVNYRESFNDRFYPISYRDDILPWLKNYILPNCLFKDIYLKSTLEQYIDYLEGMFNKRQINKTMNEILSSHIIEYLQLNQTPEENLEVLKSKINDLLKIKDQLDMVSELVKADFWDQWLKYLKEEFNEFNPIKTPVPTPDGLEQKVQVTMYYKNMPFNVAIESDQGNVFFGFNKHKDGEFIPELANVLRSIFNYEVSQGWYSWKGTTYENGYEELAELIKLTKEKCYPLHQD